MRAFRSWLVLSLLAGGAIACGDERRADPADIFSGSGSGGTSGAADPLCTEYCANIVARGTDCGEYNENQRCESICGFYRAGGCADVYSAFAGCMKTAANMACYLAPSGKWGLEIQDCGAAYQTFTACIDERDAGVCPY